MPRPNTYPRLTSVAIPIQAWPVSFSDGASMTSRTQLRSVTAALGVVVPFAAVIWLFAVPHSMSMVTHVAMTLVTLAAALVAFNTWQNGQATRNIGHVLNDAEAAAASAAPKRT